MELYHDDCIVVMDKLIAGGVKFDFVLTDPPYLFNKHCRGGAFGSENRRYRSEVAEMSNGYSVEVLDKLVQLMDKINICIFFSMKQQSLLLNYFESRNCNHTLLSWHKSNPIPACRSRYLPDTESIFHFKEKGVPIYGSYYTKKTYWVTPVNKADKKSYGHPTIKPLGIIENLIVNHTLEGDTVFDPFMGSGTTGVACKKLNRNFIGCEIDKAYFDTAQKRMNDTTDSKF